MFIRCATLTFHKFQTENVFIEKSRLLDYIGDKFTRSKLVSQLVELITPDTLNQVSLQLFKVKIFGILKLFYLSYFEYRKMFLA